MSTLRRVVLDVLKPHQPTILVLGDALADLPGVSNVEIKVEELDKKTESLLVTLTGDGIVYEQVSDTIRRLGGAVHSIDQAAFDASGTD